MDKSSPCRWSGLSQWPPTFFCVATPFCCRSSDPPPNKLPIQINIPYNLNIYVIICNNNSVNQNRYLCIIFESAHSPLQRWPYSPLGVESPPPPRLGATDLTVSVTLLSCFVDSLGPILLLTCYHGWRFCRTDTVEDHKRPKPNMAAITEQHGLAS